MKINTLWLFIIAITILTSCFDKPEYPETPQIKFNNVLFKVAGNNNGSDSLIIVIDFEDGDGDLGLLPGETLPPYNSRNYYNNKTGRSVNFATEDVTLDELITIANLVDIDTLPPYAGDYKCLRWDTNLQYSDGSPVLDTVYFQFNKRHFNIYVDYFVKENGEFRKYDWRLEGDCSTTQDGRFPMLNDTPNKSRVLEGSLRYRMVSRGFRSTFGNKTLKLRIQINDRKGNFSNIVETGEFTLNDIRVN